MRPPLGSTIPAFRKLSASLDFLFTEAEGEFARIEIGREPTLLGIIRPFASEG
jgi:hypothetical protein